MMWRYFSAQNRQFAAAGLVGALTTLSNIALLCTSAFLIARAAQMPPVLELSIAVVSVRALALSRSIGRYTERLLAHDATFRSLTAVRVSIYESIERRAPLALGSMRRGDILSRAVADVERLQDLPLRVVLPATTSAVSGIVVAACALTFLPSAGAIVTAALVIAAVAAPRAALAVAARSETTVATSAGQLTDELLEMLEGQADLMMLGAMDSAVHSLSDRDAALRNAARRLASGMGLATAVVTACQAAAVAGSVWAAGRAVSDGALSGVMSVVVGLLPLAAFETVAGLPAAALAFVGVRSSAERVEELIIDSPSGAEPALGIADAIGGDLVLSNASATWSAALAVQGVSMTARQGCITAIVGPSGGGKSTVLAVLAGLLRPTAGSYVIGDTDTAHLPGEAIRTHVALSLQDAHIFATTIAENLRLAAVPGREPDNAALRASLVTVGLGPWMGSLADGLDTVIGENGATMSGGQRQRLLAARMIIADRQVWLLDEPTEHLDEDAARDLMSAITAAAAGRTVIYASHLPRDEQSADYVIRIEPHDTMVS